MLLHLQTDPIGQPNGREPSLAKLQGNILKGHGRKHARLLFFQFIANPHLARSFIAGCAPLLTAALDELEAAARFRKEGIIGPLHVTLSLSWKGYQYLGFNSDDIFLDFDDAEQPVHPFRAGMRSRADLLNDPKVETWEVPYRQNRENGGEIHGLVTFADDDVVRLTDQVKAFLERMEGIATKVTIEHGDQLFAPLNSARPIEHLGFEDGISNPRFFARDVEAEIAGNNNVVWNPKAGPRLVLIHDKLAKDPEACGSYLVFRKLREDVQGFQVLEETLAQKLRVPPDEASAMVFGRHRDGQPLIRGGVGSNSRNNFDYQEDLQAPFTCPIHAHVRKANPRRDARVADDFRNRRIARRSITYGIDMHASVEAQDPNDTGEVGVLFLCYQRSVARQFEFMQRFWMNDSGFPTNDTGVDPIAGEGEGPPQLWHSRGEAMQFAFNSVVQMRGGEYFFTPSIVFLRNVEHL